MGDADTPFTNTSRQSNRDSVKEKDAIKHGDVECKFTSVTNTLDLGPAKTKSDNVNYKAPIRKPYRMRHPSHDLVGGREELSALYINLYVSGVLKRAVREVVDDCVIERVDIKGSSLDPVFSATDDSYLDVIDEEIQATLKLSNGEGFKEEPCPSSLLQTEEEDSDIFEMASENFLECGENVDGVADFDDAVGMIRCAINQQGIPETKCNQHGKPRPAYEFEVDCETGMISSLEIVDEADVHTDGDVLGIDNGREGEVDSECTDGDTSLCYVEFEPDDDENCFQVIRDDDLNNNHFMIVDEKSSETKLAKKTSDFRARSPTKLPRTIRDGSKCHRRRCYSMGDAERYEKLNNSSSEFYSYPDIMDRVMALPSPPRSPPGSDDFYDSDDDDDDRSSSQEELAEILQTPDARRVISLRNVGLDDETQCQELRNDTSLVARENALRIKDANESGNLSCDLETRSDLEMAMPVHHIGIGTEALYDIRVSNISYNTNHRSADGDGPGNQPPHMDSDFSCSTDVPNTQQSPVFCGIDGQPGEYEHDFDYIRRRRGDISRCELSHLLDVVARERREMDRMLRGARRAGEQHTQLRDRVAKLLDRLHAHSPVDL